MVVIWQNVLIHQRYKYFVKYLGMKCPERKREFQLSIFIHFYMAGFFFFFKGPKFERLYFGNIILPVLQMWGFRLEEIRLF